MKKRLKKIVVVGFCITLLVPTRSHAIIGDGGAGWAQIPYFIKLVAENIRRYKQLKVMIDQAKNSDKYLKLINAGLENATGILSILPIEDEKLLGTLKDFKQAYGTIQEVYGSVPKSKESAMHMLHDQTVAEGVKMYSLLTGYVKKQEQNALTIANQSRNASPRGAARMNAQVNAQILHTLNQLLKVNGQILKMGSEQFAMSNKSGKESVIAFNTIDSGVTSTLKGFKPDFALPRF